MKKQNFQHKSWYFDNFIVPLQPNFDGLLIIIY